MILFAADRHYDQHCGRVLHQHLAPHYPLMSFHEDDWRCFLDPALPQRCKLLILHFISGACNIPAPDAAAEPLVRATLERGCPVLLLHSGSAAFWQWDWWRPIVGHRWVRPNDPDGFAHSTHPVRPFRLEVAKTRHPLARQLRAIDLPEDEIYTDLEQTCPTTTLLTTTIAEGTFPQAYLATTPWGGQLAAYLPGHRPHVVAHPDMVTNVRTLIDHLLAGARP